MRIGSLVAACLVLGLIPASPAPAQERTRPVTAAAVADEAVTVFVVRHAEKGPDEPDPSLTAAGAARASALAHALGDAGVTRIFVSQFKRTQETGSPLAARLGITPTVVDARDVAGLVAQLRALPAGTRAVVVSHSNLVPPIVERLTGQQVGDLTDADYDRLYVASVRPSGPGTVLYLHFGAPAGS
jgi:broad specificity phosphatase PhoE